VVTNYVDIINECPECHANLVQDTVKGEFVCSVCGYVVEENVEYQGPDAYVSDPGNKSNNLRASGVNSIAYHDYGLHTEIDNQCKDYSGRHFNDDIRKSVVNLRKWNNIIRISNSKDRRLSNVLSKINETCSLMSFPKVVCETAALVYRNYENRNDTKGKSSASMAAAAIYYSCKICRVLRSLDEIVQHNGNTEDSNENLKLASKYYRSMVLICENDDTDLTIQTQNKITDFIQLDQKNGNKNKVNFAITNIQSININQYISKLANTAKFDVKIERLAIEIAKKTENHLLSDGKSPNGIAAAYLYLASVLLGINILQMDISRLAGVTEVTIRNRCKDILTCFRITLKIKPILKI
jgi:transcription initiation factor TFIIB